MRNPVVLVKLLRAGIRLIKDPRRLDEVIELADDVGDTETIARIIDSVAATEIGAAALRDHPRVRVDLARLRSLPEHSFGRAAARFLDERGLDPDDLPHRAAVDGPSWVRAHLLETHDLWHVATGFDTDVAGELGLQAFYLAQFPARLAALLLGIGFINTFAYSFDDKDARMDAVVRGWQLGKAARPFIGVRWSELWELPLTDVRTQLGIPTAGVTTLRAAA